jgi:hypothetical protein
MYRINTQQLHSQKNKMQQRIVIIVICLLCAFIAIAMITHETYGTLQTVQRSQVQLHRGDVQTIQSWMTLPYVAHQQHVPDTLLYANLHIKQTAENRHLTLEELAEQRKEPVLTLIHQCQTIILNYRKNHPFKPNSTPVMLRGEKSLY